MAYDNWKLASPEGEEVERDDGPLEPQEAACARHVGVIGAKAKYKPCGLKAVVRVGAKRWPACARHGGEASQLGSRLEGIDSDAQVHEAVLATPALTPAQTRKTIAIVEGPGDVSWREARAEVLLAEYDARVWS